MSVDADRTNGRYLLTSSASALTVPAVAESLAGRMEILSLWPFSQGEIRGRVDGFVNAVFADPLPEATEPEPHTDIQRQITRGGYPEPLTRDSQSRRETWYTSYITTVLQRDIRDLARIEGLSELSALMALLATQSAQILNTSTLSRTLGLPNTTLKRYLALLESTFLAIRMRPWHANVGKRLVKSPKLVITDSGLAWHLGRGRFDDPVGFGSLLETFVTMELVKQLGWSGRSVRIFHYRTHSQREVDCVLEDRDGKIVGIEVKAASTVRERDLSGMTLQAVLQSFSES